MKFNKGDVVQTKLAGLLVTGIIKSCKVNGVCVIQFDGGNEQEIPSKFIKLVEGKKTHRIETLAPKSESDDKKKSARSSTKSPARRSPARNASPSRRSNRASPSPSRKKSVTNIRSPSPKTTPTRVLKVSLENIENTIGDSIGASVSRRRKLRDADSTTNTMIAAIRKELHNVQQRSNETVELYPFKAREYSTEPDRLAYSYSKKPVDSLETITNVKDMGVFSDDDDNENIDIMKNPESKTFITNVPKEFAGWLGALLLIFLIPGSVIALHLFCNKDSCTYRKFSYMRGHKKITDAFSLSIKSCGIYVAYIMLISILSKLPFVGKKVFSQPSKESIYMYRMNGLFSAFAVLGVIVALEAYNTPIIDYIIDNYFQMMISALIFGVLLSILLFIKSKFVKISQLNPHAVTNNLIYDFFMGRQINPRIFKFDIKTILLRASYIAVLIFNSIYLFKSMNINIIDTADLLHFDNYRFDIEPTLFISSILQMIYVLDLLVFESNLTTTFELQHEGLGYMKLLQYSVYPFLMTSVTKFLYEHTKEVESNPWILTAVCLTFTAGYILYRGSNSQKNAFRLNPYDTAFQQMITLQTGKGKKLLMSGFWGKVRHPNYLGDILIHLALGACAVGSPATLSTLPVALLLAYRATRDGNRCKQRYNIAWDRYTHKVKYAVIPKIY